MMKLLIVIIISTITVGCSSIKIEHRNEIKDTITSPPSTAFNTAEDAGNASATENNDSPSTTLPETDAPKDNVENRDAAFKPDFEHIKEIMKVKKEQVLERLGKEYTLINTDGGDSDLGEGINYSKYGITIYIDGFITPGMINRINCNENVDIKGARLGMKFSEIKKILGEVDISNLNSDNPPYYALVYKFDDFIVWFAGETEDGKTTNLEIRRNNKD